MREVTENALYTVLACLVETFCSFLLAAIMLSDLTITIIFYADFGRRNSTKILEKPTTNIPTEGITADRYSLLQAVCGKR